LPQPSLSLAPVNSDWLYLSGFTFLVPAHPGSPGQDSESNNTIVIVVVVVEIVLVHCMHKHSVATNDLYINNNFSAMVSVAMNVDSALPINA